MIATFIIFILLHYFYLFYIYVHIYISFENIYKYFFTAEIEKAVCSLVHLAEFSQNHVYFKIALFSEYVIINIKIRIEFAHTKTISVETKISFFLPFQ